jgi:Ca2+-binding RTX toxin-like protein
MRLRTIFFSLTTTALFVGPALAHGALGTVAGAAKECTIVGTAANDGLNGTTRADVICSRAGADDVQAFEGDDIVRLGQGDDQGEGDDGSDVVRGQADDDGVQGDDQNDKVYGGQGDDCLGVNCAHAGGEAGNDFLKSRDGVSGNDTVDGGTETDACVIDAQDTVTSCEA